jgi:hypothetical protein
MLGRRVRCTSCKEAFVAASDDPLDFVTEPHIVVAPAGTAARRQVSSSAPGKPVPSASEQQSRAASQALVFRVGRYLAVFGIITLVLPALGLRHLLRPELQEMSWAVPACLIPLGVLLCLLARTELCGIILATSIRVTAIGVMIICAVAAVTIAIIFVPKPWSNTQQSDVRPHLSAPPPTVNTFPQNFPDFAAMHRIPREVRVASQERAPIEPMAPSSPAAPVPAHPPVVTPPVVSRPATSPPSSPPAAPIAPVAVKPKAAQVPATLKPSVPGENIVSKMRLVDFTKNSEPIDATGDGIELQRGKLKTPDEVTVPFRLDIQAKTDSTNIRVGFGRGVIIFNWEMGQAELRHQDPATGHITGIKGKGAIPANEFVQLTWIITADSSQVLVNGEERALVSGDYKDCHGFITVYPHGSKLTVKSVSITSDAK